jgi:peptidoglycan/LPS O-acetylase OafA/YrhL
MIKVGADTKHSAAHLHSAFTAPAGAGANSVRVEEIDGIRGWAALAVVVFHFLVETFTKLHPDFSKAGYAFFIDGPLAVYIFFILSGDALSTPFFKTHKKSVLDKMVLKRYFRLVAPIFVTTFFTVLAIWLGLVNNLAAASLLHREDWFGKLLPAHFDVADALAFPFLSAFALGTDGKGFNPFLWTMPIELCGSIFVFLYLYVHEKLKYPKVVLGLLIAFSMLSSQWYALFLVGVLISYIRSTGTLEKIRRTGTARVFGVALAALAYGVEYFLRTHTPIGSASNVGEALRIVLQSNEKIVMAVLFVTGSYLSVDLCRFFRTGISKFLGTISFHIYLAQITVMSTLSSFLITRFAAHLASPAACLWIAFAGIAATLVYGYILSLIERPAMRIIDAGLARVMR